MRGKFSNQFVDANQRNKDLNSFVLSNKFEYGMDQNGGIKALSKDRLKETLNPSERQNQTIVEKDPQGLKYRDLQQNYNIKPKMPLQNSPTKKIGD